jgi:predicted acetyltransferase
MPLELIRPEAAYKASFIAAIREFQAVDQRHMNLEVGWLESHFADFLVRVARRETHPVPGRVPESLYWLVDQDKRHFVGRASLRHALNEGLLEIGGHIGYEIRPSQRRRGYGRLICQLALERAWAIGLTRVMITCDETNVASRRIIEANGGVFEKAVLPADHPVPVRHYWVQQAIPG